MKHKSRAEKDRRYAASAKGQARRRRYERSAKGKVRARRWRKSSKGRRAVHRYNVSPKGRAKRERSLAKVRVRQPSGRTTAVAVPEAHRLNTAPVPAKRDPAPPHAKPEPERGMREEIMRRTAASYHLRAFLLPKLGTLRLDQIGLGEVQGLVSGMKVRRHSVLNTVGTLRSILMTARKWGYLAAEFSPSDLAISQQPSRPARFFAPEQARQIIEAAPQPWKSLYAIAAMCGLRPGEVLALTWDDIGEGEIHVRRSSCFGKLISTKTKGSVSTVPLPEPLAVILDEYRKMWKPNVEHLLFATRNGRPHTTNKVAEYRLYPLLKQLGIPQCGLNGFRHTHASLLLTAGASPMTAQRQLRHSDPLTTLRNYAHVIGPEQREATNRVAAILRPTLAKSTTETEWMQ